MKMKEHIQVCLTYGLRSFSDLEGRWGNCDSCGCTQLGPVLRDHLWFAICRDPSELLCTPCIRERLGGPIEPEHLKDIPWNMLWRAKYHAEGK